MKTVVITINDIKEIKKLMDEVDALKDKSTTRAGYSENYGNKELIIKAKEGKINNNVKIVANKICVDFDTV